MFNRRGRALISNKHGATAVKMAFILPIALLLLGVIQFGAFFYLEDTMDSVTKDVARRVANGELSEADGQQMIEDRLANWPASFAVAVDSSTPGEIEASISVPMSDAVLLDFGDSLDGDLTARTIMRRE